MERVTRAFLFHEELATQDEGASLEEALEHVLWYYPVEASRPERVKHVGLAQALLSFSDRFEQQQQQQQQQQERRRRRRRRQRLQGARDAVGGGDDDERETGGTWGARDTSGTSSSRVEVVRTSRHCHGFLECEPGVWLVMVLANRRGQQQQQQQQQDQQQQQHQWQRQRRREGGGFLGGGAGVDGGGVVAARGNGGGDWVDESALRAAMSRAYETFALMHGTVSDALRALTAMLPTGCSSGGGAWGSDSGSEDDGGTVSGFEVLRRLACARKRLRKVRREAQEEISGGDPACPEEEEQVDADADAMAETVAGAGERMTSPCSSSSSSWPQKKLSESHVEKEDGEVAVLLRASTAEPLRQSLQAFFVGYFPGAGLAEPHFHLDMGYPQSLPTDLYRRQLGLRIQQRVRKRIRSLLRADSSSAGSNFDVDIDIALTFGAGALMLAGMDPEPPEFSCSSNGDLAGNLKNDDGGIDNDRRKDGADKGKGGSWEEGGSDVQDSRGHCPGAASVAGETPEEEQRRQHEGRILLEGKEASLLMEYLGAAAFTAAGGERTADAAAPVAGLSAARSSFTNGEVVRPTETQNPQKTLWAALRSEAANGYDGVGGGVRSAAAAASLAGPSGLLNRDGSLMPCGGGDSLPRPADDLGDCAIWAPELHRADRQSTRDLVSAKKGEDEQERSTVSAAVRGETGRRQRLRRQVVAYVRGGLCALVAFRDRDKNDVFAGRGDRAGTCAAPQHNAEGEVVQKSCPGEAQEETGVGQELRASTSEVPGCRWNQLRLLSLGRAIETSLSEDPDLAVLEDDVRDFYFQSVSVVDIGSGRERRQSHHRYHHHTSQQQMPLMPGPVRAVHHQSSPLPCFAGGGLVHHPFAPTYQAAVGNTSVVEAVPTHVYDPQGAEEGGAEHALSATTTAAALESGPDAGGAHADAASSTSSGRVNGSTVVGNTSSGRCYCSSSSNDWLMVGGKKKLSLYGCGGRDTSSGSGCEFVALIQAFGHKGRPDIGVEETRRRGLGGEQELAAFDDTHARFKLQPAARELGIRTSMSKGHRWVIGRALRASGGGSSCEVIGGEMYATIEAPVSSIGDARAAAGRIFSGIGCDGSNTTTGASDGAQRSRAQGIGLGRRRFLR